MQNAREGIREKILKIATNEWTNKQTGMRVICCR